MDKLFGINGLAGFLIAVVALLAVVGFLGTCAIKSQQAQATNFYKIESQSSIEQNVKDASVYYKNAKE
ncbi:DUF4006 family protein [uncultured Helicobacter sp.]|uniref:DUF4006 family protein n=1 Tax=uncultured Helicobacter sp. TaxID=175537 RepID=UPI00374EA8F6